MSLTDFIFGKPPEQKNETASTLSPDQEALLKQLTGLLSEQAGQGVTPYSGKTAAGTSSLQQQVYDLIAKKLNTVAGTSPYNVGSDILAPFLERANQPYQAGMGVLESILSEYSPESALKAFEPIKAETLATWEKDVLPKVLEPFIAANAMDSGAARRGVAQSGEDITKSLETTLANMIYSGEQAHLERQAGALPQALSYMSTSLGIPTTAMGLGTAETMGAMNLDQILANLGLTAGGTQQTTEQNQLTAEFNKWLSGQSYSNPWLQYLGPALGTQAIENISYMQPGETGFLSEILGPAGYVAGQYVGNK